MSGTIASQYECVTGLAQEVNEITVMSRRNVRESESKKKRGKMLRSVGEVKKCGRFGGGG